MLVNRNRFDERFVMKRIGFSGESGPLYGLSRILFGRGMGYGRQAGELRYSVIRLPRSE